MGELIFFADGPDGPLPDPEAIASIAGCDRPELLLGWVVRSPDWIASTSIPATTVMVGTGTRAAVASGHVRAVPVRLSALPNLLEGRLRPAVAVVGAHESDGGWRLAGSPGVALAAARHAGALVVERWPGRGRAGAPILSTDARVAGVVDRTDPPDPPPSNRVDPAHVRIGQLVAMLLPERATIQWGPGAVGAAVVSQLEVPVRVRSGLVTDELVDLCQAGLLVGQAEAAYMWGGSGLHEMAESGLLRLAGVEHTHDLTALSMIPNFVAINTGLQVGLDGSVNVETVAGRVVSGPGGHPDFAAGAARSPGGVSIVGLPSTAGHVSTIVARPDVVSTPRLDVDVVVTEHGVADLRNSDDRERARRLIAIADPSARDDLERAAAANLR